MFDLSTAWQTVIEMVRAFVATLPLLGVGAVVFTLFYIGGKIVRKIILRFSRRRERFRNVGLVLARLGQGVLIFVGLLIALAVVIPTFNARDLIQLLGISSVAIGFAFRDVLQNFLAGILLLLTEPFRLGDQIIYDKYEGAVKDIQIRATTIVTYDGRRVVIPNAELFTNAVTVNTAFQDRRSEVDIGIGNNDDVDKAKAVMLRAIQSAEGVLQHPPPEVFVVQLADFSTKVRAWWWTQPPQRINILAVQDRVLSTIKQALIANGIDVPYPTQQILFHDQTEESDGDRERQREGWPAGTGPVPQSRWKADHNGQQHTDASASSRRLSG